MAFSDPPAVSMVGKQKRHFHSTGSMGTAWSLLLDMDGSRIFWCCPSNVTAASCCLHSGKGEKRHFNPPAALLGIYDMKNRDIGKLFEHIVAHNNFNKIGVCSALKCFRIFIP